MYKGINVKAVRKQSIISYEMRSIIIEDKEINLNCNSYKKIEKVYSESKWIDIKSVLYNQENL